jgi:hypothetical protein
VSPKPQVDVAGLVRSVAADLAYLEQRWGPDIDDDELRRGSIVLRRFLAQGELQRAWKAAGLEREPGIRHVPVENALAGIDLRNVAIGAAGGVRVGMVSTQGFFVPRRPISDEEHVRHFEKTSPPESQFILSSFGEFKESHCMVVDGHLVKRREVVKFVCNKLGGAHYDDSRGQSQEERTFKRLDRVLEGLEITQKTPVYYELLSIGQALTASDDLRRFRETAADRFPTRRPIFPPE